MIPARLHRWKVRRAARRSVVRQIDESDCGIACLAWVLQYLGGSESPERLRYLSGTTSRGTTLLDLHRTAQKIGLESDPYVARMDDLKRLRHPALLHVVLTGERSHFVVCFGAEGDRLLIGDPSVGLSARTPAEVASVWRSRALLLLRRGNGFMERGRRSRARRQWLAAAIAADVRVLVLAAVLGSAISVLGLATAVFTKELLDDILPNGDALKLRVGLLLLALVFTLQAGLGAARTLLLIGQARRFNNRITARFLTDLFRLPYLFFRSRKTGDLVARLNDSERLQRTVTYVLGALMIDALVLITGLGFIFVFSPAAAGIVAAGTIILTAVTYRFNRPIIDGQQRVMSAHSQNKSSYIECIQGIESIKVSNAETVFAGRMQETYARLQDEGYRLGELGVAFAAAVDLAAALVVTGILAWCSFLVLNGTIGIGAMVALLQVTGMIVPAAKGLASSNLELQEAAVAFERMHEFTSLKPEYDPDGEAAKSGLKTVRRIDLCDVTFRYPGRAPLLNGVSLRCRRGELIVIVGESGAGKSTLLHILEGLLVPESGTMKLNGCARRDISLLAWRSVLGVVPQVVPVLSGSILDNIRFGACLEDHVVVSRCAAYGLDERFREFPSGYQTIVGEGGQALSGGQRQLLGIARALVRDPNVLLMDEPLASMDARTACSVVRVAARLKQNAVVVVATHSRIFDAVADRVYVLEGGRAALRRPVA